MADGLLLLVAIQGEALRLNDWLVWLNSFSDELNDTFTQINLVEDYHLQRMITTFQKHKLAQHHFMASTGYGYHDLGRSTLEAVYAELWGAEAALVRQQIVSGTHAIYLCLRALAEPGQEIIFVGEPYATLSTALGLKEKVLGNLRDKGVMLRVIDPSADSLVGEILKTDSKTPIVYLQRSGGYTSRAAFSVQMLRDTIGAIKSKFSSAITFVDNCYGEFVEREEPTQIGADLMAGSLIKNPGGGLAPTGGYIVGRRILVDIVSAQLYAPGLQGEIGPNLLSPRLFFQGLFSAPHLVGQALKGAVLCAKAFSELGYETTPSWNALRADIVQRVVLGNPEDLKSFCRAIQHASPVDSNAVPEPTLLPGYEDSIIMAGGTFIQGSSSELTVDAPYRPPFAFYWQGALCFSHAKYALACGLDALFTEVP